LAVVEKIDVSRKFAKCECYSNHDPYFYYKEAHRVEPTEPFNTDINSECTSGIHFFFSEKEASDY